MITEADQGQGSGMGNHGSRVLLVDGGQLMYDDIGELVGSWSAARGTWDLSQLLHEAANVLGAPGVVLLTAGALADLGIGFPMSTRAAEADAADHPVLNSARMFGWMVSRLAPWMSFRHDHWPTITVACLPWLDSRTGPLWHEGIPAGEFAADLARYHQLVGVPFYATPGVSGLALMRGCTSLPVEPRWVHPAKAALAGIRHVEDDYRTWSQPGNGGGAFEHTYDAVGMYLGSAGATYLPLAELAYARGGVFNQHVGGYWQIVPPVWNNPNMPHPCGNHRASSPLIWVTTPTMVLLAELAADGLLEMPGVVSSWTAKSARVLRQWQHRVRTALELIDDQDVPGMRRAVKATYAEAVGLLGREGGRVFRPDWRFHLIATARCNLFRRGWRIGEATGRWPVAIKVDALTYSSDEFDAVAGAPKGLPLGDTLGRFRVLGTTRAAARVDVLQEGARA